MPQQVPQQLNYTTTISTAKLRLVELCETIFKSLDYASVEEEIATASKIRFGLKAYLEGSPYTDADSQQRIIVTLNKLCNIYNQQNAPFSL